MEILFLFYILMAMIALVAALFCILDALRDIARNIKP
jgi:hypothetical protein